MNSFDKYQELQNNIRVKKKMITHQLVEHDPGPALNWSKCGDLDYVSEQLAEVINFLGRTR